MNREIKKIFDGIYKFKKLDDYPLNSKIFIYSNNNLAKNLLYIISELRPDITFLGYINSDNKKVDLTSDIITITPDMLSDYEYDFVVVTIINYLHQVEGILKTIPPSKLGINLVSNLSYHPPYQKDGSSINTNKNIVDYIYNHLEGDDDKMLWSMIKSSISSCCIDTLVDWFLLNGKPQLQYIEHDLINKNDILLEFGVYDATNTCQFAKLVGENGKVYGFEPLDSSTYQANIEKDSSLKSRISIFQCAISDFVGELKFSQNGPSTKQTENEHDSVVPCTTIDHFIDEYHIPRIDFIKMDIEGAEPAALKGGLASIKKFRPSLAISIYHGIDQFIGIPYMLMKNLEGYKFKLGCYSVFGEETILYCIPNEKIK